MEIRCVITDDEPFARKGLKSYIKKIEFLSLVGECEDALQLNNILKTKSVDLIFLDIEMPEMTGIELLSSLENSPKIIIVSAYEQYALKGYEFNVVDYLLKPVSFERFLKSVNKVYSIFQNEKTDISKDHIFVKSNKQLKKILIADLLFVESLENYVILHTISSKEIVYITLKQMFEKLPKNMFVQTHRSYIVNLNRITAINGHIINIGSHHIPISRNSKEDIINRLKF
ncbi:LytR/AlgR family response regulator transcription factor [Chryseobacterium sp. RLHN22]|uniref:LytR/AlgR family response regulator transcription factor n=1 Tax=Chryseobacterium sp. RLHN22 TaxID=3437885 RepID=UPI003D9BEA6F